MAKKNYNDLADHIIEKVGGTENVNTLTHCVTRLRFKLKDEGVAKTDELKALDGVMTVIKASGQYQVVIGNDVVNVFDAIVSRHKVSTGEALNVNEDAPKEEKPTGPKAIFAKVMDYITGTMVQLLPVLIAAGLLSVVLSIATNFCGLSTDGSTYKVLNAVYDAGFYFLPVMVGFAAAKRLGSNPFLAGFMGAILIHPTLISMVTEGATELFGLHYTSISYAKTVIPMLLIAFVMSYVEKFTYKFLPTAIKSTFAPLITVFVMVPLSLFILGPMGYMVGSAIVSVILWIYGISPFLIVPLSAISWPILVMFGAHTLLVPTMTDLVATMGFDAAIKPGAYCSNFAELGVLLGVAFRSKKMRSTALSAASSCVFGITEPAMYGVILPLKKTMFSMIGASAIGGAVAGFLSVKAYVPTANSILSLVMFGDTIVYAAIATAISVVAGFILTLLIGFDDKKV